MLTITPVVQAQTPMPPVRYTAERWRLIRPGLEYGLYYPPNANAQLIVTRINPEMFAFGTHYRPGEPLDLAGWSAEIPCAVGFFNTNFFTADYTVRGLLAADGEVYGETFERSAGMLQVDESGAVRVRSLIHEPYEAEPLIQAVQGFPLLVYAGEVVYAGGGNDEPTRRTVVGQDGEGRIVVITVTGVGVYLDVLAAYLAQTDLRLEIAVNLDGGTSTLLKLDSRYGNVWTVESAYPVPAVMAIYARARDGLCTPDSLICSCLSEVAPESTETRTVDEEGL